jgi:hypothetical protein
MSITPASDESWLDALFGLQAAQVLRAYSVRCLHNAHAQASWRYRQATWTNNTTSGTDRYYCLCSTLGTAVEARVPYAKVHRPDEEFGEPFLIEFGNAALYVYRYGDFSGERHQGLALRSGWLRDQLARRAPHSQEVLSFPNFPEIPLSRVAFLAWAGNRVTGLERAFFGIPYLDSDDRLSFDEPVEDLDITQGQAFALPGVDDKKEPPRHSFDLPSLTGTQPPPAFGLELLDSDSKLDPASLFADTGTPDTALPTDGMAGHDTDEDEAGEDDDL